MIYIHKNFIVYLFVFTLVSHRAIAQKDDLCVESPNFCNAILYAAALRGDKRLREEEKRTPQCFNARATRDALTHAVKKRDSKASRKLLMLDAFYQSRDHQGMINKSVKGFQQSYEGKKSRMGTSMAEFFLSMSVGGMVAKKEPDNWGLVGSAALGFGAGFVLGWCQYDMEKEKSKKARENKFESAVKEGKLADVLAFQVPLYHDKHHFKVELDLQDLSRATILNGSFGAGLGYVGASLINKKHSTWHNPATRVSAGSFFSYFGRSTGEEAARRWYSSEG